ncbi:hypothetical protein JHK85_010485 [Glycine max]|nr:hypothetical protein JHK85_010485 [Glycine max]
MERNNEGKWALVHSVSRHGLTTASLHSCCRLCRDFASCQDQSGKPLSSSPTTPPSTTPPVVAPINVVDHCLPYEKHNFYDVTFNNTVLYDHHHHVLTVGPAYSSSGKWWSCTSGLTWGAMSLISELIEVHECFCEIISMAGREPKTKSRRKSYRFVHSFILNDANIHHPLAGRLRSVDDDTHKLEVDCNGEGVVFAEAFMARVLVYYSPSHNTDGPTYHAHKRASARVICPPEAAISVRVRVGVRTSSHSSWCSSSMTLDLSSSGPLRVCVYSDPGAHLSVKFPSKELLEKCGWNGVVEVI